jgi:hypothetical protein
MPDILYATSCPIELDILLSRGFKEVYKREKQ